MRKEQFMKTALDGYGQMVLTLEGGGLSKGDIVKMSGNKTVSKAGAGEAFCGVVVSPDTSYAGVQTHGYVELPYSGAVSVGYQQLVADGNGGVTAGEDKGQEYLVIFAEDNTVGILL